MTIRNTAIIIATVLGSILTACGSGGSHKPLMGGISSPKETQAQTTDKDNSKASGKSAPATISTAAIAGLECPALRDGSGEIVLKRAGYTASYNTTTRIPNWVAWHLTAQHTEGDVKRPQKAFHEDEDVPAPRAVDWDYYGSGYDRGHMCPAGDNKWSEDAMLQSFLFTNICPQNHNLNIGDWQEMEKACRKWAKQYGDIYIVCGPILYKSKHKTIGDNRVVVPEAFFKVVLCMQDTPKAIGFIYKNDDGNRPMGDYVNTVNQVERITGIDFFPALPDDIEKQVESHSDLSQWTD